MTFLPTVPNLRLQEQDRPKNPPAHNIALAIYQEFAEVPFDLQATMCVFVYV
jgi:hypothetical protein